MLNDEKYICGHCVGDDFLKDVIQNSDGEAKCTYCGGSQPSIEVSELAEYVQRAFREHHLATANQPDALECMVMSDKESDYSWERQGELVVDIIQDEAGVEPEVAEDIRACLDSDRSFDGWYEESEFDDQIRYERCGQYGSRWHDTWEELEHDLKTRTRFFSKKALGMFQAVFDGISSDATKDGRPIFKTIAAGFELYRARVFQSDDRLKEALEKPAQRLGPPLKDATAGRMNACGISVFYGSTSCDVALAEVRPPAGSKVVISKFVLQHEATLLDLTALQFVEVKGSIFDREYVGRIERAEFLKTFCDKITVPVMPDFEISEYLITQATADYLALDERLDLDGIIYPSVQTPDDTAMNIALFNKSAKVTGANDATFDVRLTACDDGMEYPDYSITPSKTKASTTNRSVEDCSDDRRQMLVFDEKSLIVAHVTRVAVTAETHHVSLYNQGGAQEDPIVNPFNAISCENAS